MKGELCFDVSCLLRVVTVFVVLLTKAILYTLADKLNVALCYRVCINVMVSWFSTNVQNL